MEEFPDCVDLKILHFGLTCGERVRIMIKLLNLQFPNLRLLGRVAIHNFFQKIFEGRVPNLFAPAKKKENFSKFSI